MKRLLLIGLLVACGKSNDVSTLHQEAVQTAAYYQAKLDGVDRRVNDIFRRGTTIPANLPGIEEVGRRLTEAKDTLIQLRGILAKGPDGKSAVEKQADLAAKDRKVEDLEKLIQDTDETAERGLRVITDDLNAVEGWIAIYDQGLAHEVAAAPTPAPTPAQPEATPPAPAPTAPQTPAPQAKTPAPQAKTPAAPVAEPPAKK